MLDQKFIELLSENDAELFFDEPMSKRTTFRIGGNADCVCEVHTLTALRSIMKLCNEYDVPYYVLGLGSNLLVSDQGVRGLMIRLTGEFNDITLKNDNIVCCKAGATLAGLCVFARDRSLSGVEFAWGIPGSVGGAVYMNAGAYGGEMKDVVISVTCVDKNGCIRTYTGEELDFSYRHSAFSDTDSVITDVSFQLKKGDAAVIADRMQELMNRRKQKQPINHPSAGSVFKRPSGYYAAALIDECGLKGYTVGGANVSEKHAGFIVNDHNASAEDVKELIKYIQKVVKEKKGVQLTCEIRMIGE